MCDDIHEGLIHDPTVSRRTLGILTAAAAGVVATGAYAADVTETDVQVKTPDGMADAALYHPAGKGPWPGVLIWCDFLSLRPVFREMGRRLAGEGYVVLVPRQEHRARGRRRVPCLAVGDAAEPARALVAGRDHERLLQPRHGLRIQFSIVAGEGTCCGGLDQCLGVVGPQPRDLRECFGGLGRAPLRVVRAAEQAPAFGLLRRTLEFGLELCHGVRHRVRCSSLARIERGRGADQQVEQPGCHDHARADCERGSTGAAPHRAQDEGRNQHRERDACGHENGDAHHSCSSSRGTSTRPLSPLRASRNTTNPPSRTSTPGPNQSGQVAGSTRGR